MKFESSPRAVSGNSYQTTEEYVRDLCRLARGLEETGEYEKAEATLAEFWGGAGTEPHVEGLGEPEAAEVLLRAGAITRRISRAEITAGVQESAKDLISQGLYIFERLGFDEKVAEARSELAYCYWRKGEYDNARVLLREAIPRFTNSDLKAEALLRLSVVEKSAGRTREALALLEGAAPFFDSSESPALKGRFHLEHATFLKNLGEYEGKEELTDAALIEYEAASYYFESAGNKRNIGLVENQLGFLFLKKGRLPEAHIHLDRARRSFSDLGDYFRVAQVDETRARAFLEEGRYAEAVRTAAEVVGSLQEGDTHALLAEALTTLGTAHARGCNFEEARTAFRQAIDSVETAGDPYLTAVTLLTAAEELACAGNTVELLDLYVRASSLLGHDEESAALKRLHKCADSVLRVVKQKGVAPDSIHLIAGLVSARVTNTRQDVQWDDFSLNETIHEIEKAFAQRALRDADGSVTKAALMLGYKYSESLNSKVNKLGLQEARLPLRPRRRSIIGKEFRKRKTTS